MCNSSNAPRFPQNFPLALRAFPPLERGLTVRAGGTRYRTTEPTGETLALT